MDRQVEGLLEAAAPGTGEQGHLSAQDHQYAYSSEPGQHLLRRRICVSAAFDSKNKAESVCQLSPHVGLLAF